MLFRTGARFVVFLRRRLPGVQDFCEDGYIDRIIPCAFGIMGKQLDETVA
jgi:hypothetical protein